MGYDGYSRGVRVLPPDQGAARFVKETVIADLPTTIKMGRKEKTGSVIENPPVLLYKGSANRGRFDTEMVSNYVKRGEDGKEYDVDEISRSGYSLNNRYNPQRKIIDEVRTDSVFKQIFSC